MCQNSIDSDVPFGIDKAGWTEDAIPVHKNQAGVGTLALLNVSSGTVLMPSGPWGTDDYMQLP